QRHVYVGVGVDRLVVDRVDLVCEQPRADAGQTITGRDEASTTPDRGPTDLARLHTGEEVGLTDERGSFNNDTVVVVLELVPHNGTAWVQRYITGHGELDVVVRVREVLRSEERRVGKECRSGGSQYQEKKEKKW